VSGVFHFETMRPGQLLLAVATAAAFGLALRAALGHSLEPWLAALCLLAYVGIIFAGITLPALGMWADVLCKIPSARGVVLTFEGGPHPIHTRVVLDALDAAGASASFFVSGERAAKYPDLIREILARGHEIAGLGEHPSNLLFGRVPSMVDDLVAMKRGLDRAGAFVSFVRPPFGFTNPRLPRACEGLGLTIVAWSINVPERRAPTHRDQILRAVVPWLREGEILRLRDALDGSDSVPGSVEALPTLLEAISDRNLTAQSVSRALSTRSTSSRSKRPRS
jgi:peptidoglycan/xylan/chitin deacetylase (PgdA/CDA1 family)